MEERKPVTPTPGWRKGRKGPAVWAAVDWSKPVAQIAAELGVTSAAVYFQRKRRASAVDVVTPEPTIGERMGEELRRSSNGMTRPARERATATGMQIIQEGPLAASRKVDAKGYWHVNDGGCTECATPLKELLCGTMWCPQCKAKR